MSNYMDYLARRVGYKTYNEYLRSDHWKSFSEYYRRRRCFCCGKTVAVEVHHTCYDNLGNELPDDVIAVCPQCHHEIHVLVKTGVSLKTAHFKTKQSKQNKQNKRQKWVSNWRKLLNKSKKQTITELQAALQEWGLVVESDATQAAYVLHYVKYDDGKEIWNLPKYIRLMQNCKKMNRYARSELNKIRRINENWTYGS